jgi:hypothetical protein
MCADRGLDLSCNRLAALCAWRFGSWVVVETGLRDKHGHPSATRRLAFSHPISAICSQPAWFLRPQLQARCAARLFAAVSSPPIDSGMMWSMLADLGCGCLNDFPIRLRQIPHRQLSRSRICASETPSQVSARTRSRRRFRAFRAVP